MRELGKTELEEIFGGDDVFRPGDSLSVGFPSGITMQFGDQTLNRWADRALDMLRGPGPSAFTAVAGGESAFSAVSRSELGFAEMFTMGLQGSIRP